MNSVFIIYDLSVSQMKTFPTPSLYMVCNIVIIIKISCNALNSTYTALCYGEQGWCLPVEILRYVYL